MELKSGQHNVQLRSIRPQDLSSLVQLANNPKIASNLRNSFPHPYTEKDALAFIEAAQSAEIPFRFAIEMDGILVGNIAIHVHDDVYQKNAELGYFVGKPYWGQGIATKAVELITAYGFKAFDLERVFAGVFSGNPASARVLEKAGFEFEGTFKNAIYKNGAIYDELRYGILK